jgi:hypothetical protein
MYHQLKTALDIAVEQQVASLNAQITQLLADKAVRLMAHERWWAIIQAAYPPLPEGWEVSGIQEDAWPAVGVLIIMPGGTQIDLQAASVKDLTGLVAEAVANPPTPPAPQLPAES